jgi:hypothetical protein
MTTKTEVVYGSQMEDLAERIALIRDPSLKDKRAEEKAALRKYERARGNRKEVEGSASGGMFTWRTLGFKKTVAGHEMFIPRPTVGKAAAYG